jgi:hypothetical protein
LAIGFQVPGVNKPMSWVLIDRIEDFKNLDPNKTIIAIANDHNILRPTVVFDVHVHIAHHSNSLQIMYNLYFVFECHV